MKSNQIQSNQIKSNETKSNLGCFILNLQIADGKSAYLYVTLAVACIRTTLWAVERRECAIDGH